MCTTVLPVSVFDVDGDTLLTLSCHQGGTPGSIWYPERDSWTTFLPGTLTPGRGAPRTCEAAVLDPYYLRTFGSIYDPLRAKTHGPV